MTFMIDWSKKKFKKKLLTETRLEKKIKLIKDKIDANFVFYKFYFLFF